MFSEQQVVGDSDVIVFICIDTFLCVFGGDAIALELFEDILIDRNSVVANDDSWWNFALSLVEIEPGMLFDLGEIDSDFRVSRQDFRDQISGFIRDEIWDLVLTA